MRTGVYKGLPVKIYSDGDIFIIEFSNGSSITASNTSEIKFDD